MTKITTIAKNVTANRRENECVPNALFDSVLSLIPMGKRNVVGVGATLEPIMLGAGDDVVNSSPIIGRDSSGNVVPVTLPSVEVTSGSRG